MEQQKPKESLPLQDGPRNSLRREFLRQEGLENAPLIPLAGDGSQRHYFRLPHALLMDAPPPHEGTSQFETVAHLLQDVGLSTPQIYAANHTHGFLLIEDFGDLTYRQALRKGAKEKILYQEVITSLAHLHQQPFSSEKTKEIPTYDAPQFLEKVSLFLEWTPFSFSESSRTDFLGYWHAAYQTQPSLPLTFVLRDVMVDNLFWLPDRTGFQRCGFIDFQDASWGAPPYDLSSVLEDIRRDDLPPDFIEMMIETYCKHFPSLPQEIFWQSYFLWGAQRTTRIIGTFFRLAKRDGKPNYLRYLPRLWQLLDKQLRASSLKDLRTWYKTQGVLP